jgi:NAD(P)-dependent dehydrogenase (short-subunit alcohol dehydrogenase family)
VRAVEEQVIIVTGATDGLGRATARELAARGATVLVHGRSRERGEQAVAEIVRATGNERPELHLADLASLAEVVALAEDVARDHERLDVLINNAGVVCERRRLSRDGHELTFAVNHLSHFLLTRRLLPLVRRSTPARIVNVSSTGQSPIDFGDVMLERRYGGFRAYAQSKLAQIMFTFELSERLRAEGEERVAVNAVHPATLMDTKMVRDYFGRARTTVEEGAKAVLRLVISPELEGVTGRYFEGTRVASAHPQAYDQGARRRLWDLSEELTGR